MSIRQGTTVIATANSSSGVDPSTIINDTTISTSTAYSSYKIETRLTETLESIPKNLSEYINDVGYLTQSDLSDYVKLSELESLGYYKLYKFQDITVETTAWTSDTTYTNYPYVASITLENVTSTMIPEVIFDPTDSTSGNYCPVAESYDGGIKIWCKEVPTETLTILTIYCQ